MQVDNGAAPCAGPTSNGGKCVLDATAAATAGAVVAGVGAGWMGSTTGLWAAVPGLLAASAYFYAAFHFYIACTNHGALQHVQQRKLCRQTQIGTSKPHRSQLKPLQLDRICPPLPKHYASWPICKTLYRQLADNMVAMKWRSLH